MYGGGNQDVRRRGSGCIRKVGIKKGRGKRRGRWKTLVFSAPRISSFYQGGGVQFFVLILYYSCFSHALPLFVAITTVLPRFTAVLAGVYGCFKEVSFHRCFRHVLQLFQPRFTTVFAAFYSRLAAFLRWFRRVLPPVTIQFQRYLQLCFAALTAVLAAVYNLQRYFSKKYAFSRVLLR